MPSPRRNNGASPAYQLDDRPHRPLDMPMGPLASSDRLAGQPTVCIAMIDFISHWLTISSTLLRAFMVLTVKTKVSTTSMDPDLASIH
jgi:hypothetical protein